MGQQLRLLPCTQSPGRGSSHAPHGQGGGECAAVQGAAPLVRRCRRMRRHRRANACRRCLAFGAAAQAAALHSKPGAWLKPCPIGATTTNGPVLFVFGILGICTRNVGAAAQGNWRSNSRSPPRLPSHARAGLYCAAHDAIWGACSADASNKADADADQLQRMPDNESPILTALITVSLGTGVIGVQGW